MHIDLWISVAGLVVGATVGLTGMGGGALMTPLLVLVFRVDPLTAVSSDVVASLVMKPIGGSVHLRRGTVNKVMVGWLCLGSVPSAFGGVVILNALGGGDALQDRIKLLLGAALLVAAISIFAKGIIASRRGDADRARDARDVTVRPVPTVVIGVLGGLVVGMTSVGSGSLMIVLLLFLYPRLSAGQMVGTDLVQAIPLVASAALGHLLFGDFALGLTTSLLIGAMPGVYLGARVSSKAPDGFIRPVLLVVLFASALKLLGASPVVLAGAVGAVVAGAAVGWLVLRAQRSAAASTGDVHQVVRSHREVLEDPSLEIGR